MSVVTPLMLAGEAVTSRLWIGTGGLTSPESVRGVVEAAQPGLVTVSVRRTSTLAAGGLLSTLRELGVRILPNTAG
ncbi:MAG: thiazole synthase, partial [Nocardioides sp.]|nr:thiazole synthase [Nocardioides sp.]